MPTFIRTDPSYGRAGLAEAARLEAAANKENLYERGYGYGFPKRGAVAPAALTDGRDPRFSLFPNNPNVGDGKFHNAQDEDNTPDGPKYIIGSGGKATVLPANAEAYGFPAAAKTGRVGSAAGEMNANERISQDQRKNSVEDLMYRAKYGATPGELNDELAHPKTILEKTATPGGVFAEPGREPSAHGLTFRGKFTPQPSVAKEVNVSSDALKSFQKEPMNLQMMQERMKEDARTQAEKDKQGATGAKQLEAALEFAGSYVPGQKLHNDKGDAIGEVTRPWLENQLALKFKGVPMQSDTRFEKSLGRFGKHIDVTPPAPPEKDWRTKVSDWFRPKPAEAVPMPDEAEPADQPEEKDEHGFVVGQQYKMRDGNMATYKGNGEFE